MLLFVNNEVYETSREMLNKILQSYRNSITEQYVIYAIEKENMIEIRNDVCNSAEDLHAKTSLYLNKEFDVYQMIQEKAFIIDFKKQMGRQDV